MRTLYRFFLLLAVGLLTALSGCGEDETPSLATYPDNNFSLVAEDGEGSEITVNATYNNEGILEFDKPVIFTFRFNASPEDAIVTFEPIGEDVELSDTKLIIPAGYTDASVTVQGYKMPSISLEAKALIKKEAYVATGFLEGKAGNKTTFEHIYFNGEFKDTERNLYTFSVQLDRPARKDVKVKLTTEGVDDEYLKDISITPAEIIIPAGEKTSGDITWEITNDFLLRTSADSSNTLNITAVFECEDPVFVQDEKRSSFTLNINKYIRGFEHISYKRPSGWIEWAKQGWSVDVEDSSDFYQNDGGGSLIDGETKGNYEGICSDGDISFTLDMGEEKTIT